MTLHFNISRMKERRRQLRRNLPRAEAKLWKYLARRQMLGCKFRRQYSVDSYVIDFYSPELKLAIEVDGDSHFAPGAHEYDKERQEHIESFGISFVRIANHEVLTNIEGVCQTISAEIEKRRRALPSQQAQPTSSPPP